MGRGLRGRELERKEKGENCWGRCKPFAYKVAIRGKVALCEARGTSVPITAAHKRMRGCSGGGTMVSNMSRASPNTTG